MNLAERDKRVIWHPYTQMKTSGDCIPIIKAEGVYIHDENGKKYIDAISSWWVNLHGHCHPYINLKLTEQLEKLEHVIFAGFTHEPAIELAERVLDKLGAGFDKVFYTDNGSTAVEVALKMAIQYWKNKGRDKKRIIAFENAYHGDTFGAMSISSRSVFTQSFDDYLFEVEVLPLPTHENIEALEQKIISIAHECAAFIFEPLVQGAGGMEMYEAEPLSRLISICKKENIICIDDEVMTGFGRTGKWFAFNYLTETPDIICLSKGITGGFMAMGVTVCSEKIYQAFYHDDKKKALFHGHSYTANPITCSVALASMDLMEKASTWEAITGIHKAHHQFSLEIGNHPKIKDIRLRGTILAITITSSEETSYLNNLRDTLYAFFLQEGILLRPLGNVIYIMPPYVISPDELKYIYNKIKLALDTII